MRLTVVGCSGSFAGPDSAASCYVVQADDAEGRTWTLVLDLGSGAFGPLQRVIDPRYIDALLVSHLHPDHIADITGLYVYRRYHPENATTGRGRMQPTVVWGPAHTRERAIDFGIGVEAADDGCDGSTTFTFATWQPGTPLTVGPLRIEPFTVRHPIPAYAMRVCGPSEMDAGREIVLTYSGDTDMCPGVIAAAQGADVLLCEAAFVEGRDDHIDGIHLTGRRAGQVARDAGVGRLLLTHRPPWNQPGVATDEAVGVYDGPVQEVAAGQHFVF